jgi:hypothetical protein
MQIQESGSIQFLPYNFPGQITMELGTTNFPGIDEKGVGDFSKKYRKVSECCLKIFFTQICILDSLSLTLHIRKYNR